MADSGALFHTPNLGCWAVLLGDGRRERRGWAVRVGHPGRFHGLTRAPGQHPARRVHPDRRRLRDRQARHLVGVGDVPPPDRVVGTRRTGRAPKVTKVTPRPVVATPRRSTAKVHVQRPPLAAATTIAAVSVVPAGSVSRSLTRLPLAEAERLTAQFGVGEEAVTGTDPVSRLLDFAAKAAGSD